LLEKRPFSKKTLKEYSNKNYGLSPVSTPRMIASPRITNSKFSPVNTIGKSPQMTKKIAPKLSGFGKLNDEPFKDKNSLSKFGTGGHGKVDTKVVENDVDHDTVEIDHLDLNSPSKNLKTVNVNRKDRNIFKDINSIETTNQPKNKDDDLPILEGIKASKKKDKDDDE